MTSVNMHSFNYQHLLVSCFDRLGVDAFTMVIIHRKIEDLWCARFKVWNPPNYTCFLFTFIPTTLSSSQDNPPFIVSKTFQSKFLPIWDRNIVHLNVANPAMCNFIMMFRISGRNSHLIMVSPATHSLYYYWIDWLLDVSRYQLQGCWRI